MSTNQVTKQWSRERAGRATEVGDRNKIEKVGRANKERTMGEKGDMLGPE